MSKGKGSKPFGEEITKLVTHRDLDKLDVTRANALTKSMEFDSMVF